MSVQAQSGETGDYGVTIPFTRSPRTERYLFEVYDGASAQGTPLFKGKELEISVLGQMDIFLPLQYDLAGPHTYTLKITALPMPGREGLDLAASQTKTFQTGLVSTCGHSTADGGFVLGAGTADDPYRVASARQLDHVRQHLSDNFLQVAHIDVGETYSAWEPIIGFTGSYDGDGWAIQNLSSKTLSYTYQGYSRTASGLFGVCYNATLRGVCMYDYKSLDSTARDAAALTASLWGNTVVEECCVHGAQVAGELAGGLVGDDNAQGGTLNVQIKNCYVKSVVVSSVGGRAYAGGLASAINDGDGGAIVNCYAVPTRLSGGLSRGGLEGLGRSPITGCFYLSNAAWNNGYGTPKTEAELKSAATFTGWDTNIWEIKDGSYPTLKIERPLP